MKKTISIEGMSCGHCLQAVEKALRALPGVSAVAVSLAEKQAVVELSDAVADAALKTAVEDQGYEVTAIR